MRAGCIVMSPNRSRLLPATMQAFERKPGKWAVAVAPITLTQGESPPADADRSGHNSPKHGIGALRARAAGMKARHTRRRAGKPVAVR